MAPEAWHRDRDRWRLVRYADARWMPWKNGGGETTELLCWPEGASIDAFIWRLSLATVAASGGFSRFPGVDRTLTLLDGAGMILSLDQRDVHLIPGSEPIHFSGDDPCRASLPDGPTRDLNVMSRRGSARHAVAFVAPGAEAPSGPADFRVVFAARSAAQCMLAGQSHALGLHDCFYSANAGTWPKVSSAESWLAISIRLET